MTPHHSQKHLNGTVCDFSVAITNLKENSYKRLNIFLPVLMSFDVLTF